jgi:hypothetical protein
MNGNELAPRSYKQGLSSLQFQPRRRKSRSRRRHHQLPDNGRSDNQSWMGIPVSTTSQVNAELADTSVRQPRVTPTQWLEKMLTLVPEERTAYVLAWIVECISEQLLAEDRSRHVVRWPGLGLSNLNVHAGPRKAITAIRGALDKQHVSKEELQKNMEIEASVAMIASVARSAKSYASGLRCWGAFCDMAGIRNHFPAEQQDVLAFQCIFRNVATYTQYLNHLRFAHRLLRMLTPWYDPIVKQVERGARKLQPMVTERPALLAPQVRAVIQAAKNRNDVEMATIYAVARLFLLRVPSEGLPLQRNGPHSHIEVEDSEAYVTLHRRKNSNKPALIHRSCVCRNEGVSLCAVCSLQAWMERNPSDNNIFNISTHTFLKYFRRDLAEAGIANPERYGSHAFRRGMARDIILAGGTLGTLLAAGQWSSGAYKAYLQSQAVDEHAVAKLLIDHSDDE